MYWAAYFDMMLKIYLFMSISVSYMNIYYREMFYVNKCFLLKSYIKKHQVLMIEKVDS